MAIVGVSIEDFLANGCDCTLGCDKNSCLETFPRDEFIECRDKLKKNGTKQRRKRHVFDKFFYNE